MAVIPSDMQRQLVAFVGVGLVNTAVGVGVIMAAFHLLDWGPLASNAAGYAVGYVLSYVLHRFVTFQSGASTRRSLPRYTIVLACGYVANVAMLFGLLGLGAPFFWAQLCALLTFSVLVFAGLRLFAFTQEP